MNHQALLDAHGALHGAGDDQPPDRDLPLDDPALPDEEFVLAGDRAADLAVHAQQVREHHVALDRAPLIQEAIERSLSLFHRFSPASNRKSRMSSSSLAKRKRISPPRRRRLISTVTPSASARRSAAAAVSGSAVRAARRGGGCNRRSSSRTLHPSRAHRRPSSSWRSAALTPARARAWPADNSPASTISCTDSGNWSRRKALATVERSFPTRAAIASCARPSSARR